MKKSRKSVVSLKQYLMGKAEFLCAHRDELLSGNDKKGSGIYNTKASELVALIEKKG